MPDSDCLGSRHIQLLGRGRKMEYYTDNPVADAERYYADQEREMQKLPKCSECGEPITDDFCWDIDGEIYCQDCADKLFCHLTENYMEE